LNKVKVKVEEARGVSSKMPSLPAETKNSALNAIAEGFMEKRLAIFEANKKDLEAAEELLARGEINEAFFNRLRLDEDKLNSIVDMMRSVAKLEDPVLKTDYAVELDNGLELYRVSSPIGVIGVIFESRPDALPQIASLCLKSGNTVLLKGGIESKNTNTILYSIIKEVTESAGIPPGWIHLLEERSQVSRLLALDGYVDLIIPRGSNAFVRYIQENTRIPVLGHSEGVCHIYVDEGADITRAVEVCNDAKVQYPSVCNAVDTIVIHRDLAPSLIPPLVEKLKGNGVEIRGDKGTREISREVIEASEDEWGSEYLDYIVSLKIVDDMDEAIKHINRYGSHHTDAIITEDKAEAMKFISEVDSASVMWNASTRFSDGYRYGLGAEVGISTGKIHARGPTGLEGLLIYKYHLVGNGHTVKNYTGSDGRAFTHKTLNKTWKHLIQES
jgi:glutamate-5-semialdehyde dehydrogenase